MPDEPAPVGQTGAPATSARVSFRELLNAFELVNFQGDNEAFICRQTGKIAVMSALGGIRTPDPQIRSQVLAL
jgi:hypothetical protein